MVAVALVERDYRVMRDIERFRCCLGRHIKILADFEGLRQCDRRLKSLLEAGYVSRKIVLYGVPSVYSLTHKGKMLIGANKRQDKIRVERVVHDIAVLDTVIYFMLKHEIEVGKIITEKELNSTRGFEQRKHQPDFVFKKADKTYCVEIELTAKSKQRFVEIVQENYLNYDTQYWVIAKTGVKILKMLESLQEGYPNIEIMEMEEIQEFARNNK